MPNPGDIRVVGCPTRAAGLTKWYFGQQETPMNFDFSDDQNQLRDAVQRWVGKAYTFERRKGIVAAGGFSREVYGELAELGLCGLCVPDTFEGMGMGAIEAMVVMEQLGAGLVL